MSGAKAVVKKKTIRNTYEENEHEFVDVTPAMKAHKWTDEEIHRLVCDILNPQASLSIRDEARRIVVHFLSADDLVRYREAYLAVERTLPYI